MSILDTRAAIVEAIKTAIPTLRTCAEFAGTLNVEELKRLGTVAPAVLVSCEDLPETAVQGGQVASTLRWVAYIVTTDQAQQKLKRGDLALSIVEQLLAILGDPKASRWGLTSAQRTQKIRGRNMYSSELDRMGLALWVITWNQATDLDAPGAAAAALVTVDAKIDSPTTGQTLSEDTVTLEQ